MKTVRKPYENIAADASDYFRHHAGPALTESQNRQLGALVRAGDAKAREQMIEGNISLALTFSAPLVPCWDRDEVLSNALLGIIDAVDRYDPNKGTFSSYAKIKVRQVVMVAFANQRPLVRVPRNVAQKLMRWRRVHGDSDDVMPPDLAAVSALEKTRSLDDRIGADEDLTLADVLAAPASEFPPGEREEIEERLAGANQFVEVLDAVGTRLPAQSRPPQRPATRGKSPKSKSGEQFEFAFACFNDRAETTTGKTE